MRAAVGCAARRLLAAVALAAGVLACGGPAERREGTPPGVTHAPGEEREGEAAIGEAAARRALAGAGDPADVLRAAAALERAGGELDEGGRARVYRAADDMAAGDLTELWGELGGGAASAAAALRAAKWRRHVGDREGARAWLERVEGDPRLEARAAELEAEMSAAGQGRAGRVAALLPLSGPHAEVGEAIRRGAELAAERVGGGAELVAIDTEGDRDAAATAVLEADEGGATLALGPVGRESARAAAARASARGLPLALLSPSADGAPSAGVFRLWSSAAWEGREAARLARELRYDRVGILAPRDEGAAARARAFADEAERRGITVARRGGYDPTGRDLESDLRAFLDLDPATNERLRRHLRRRGERGWKTFVPDLDVDLLYIPDAHDQAALLASHLPYFNVEIRTDPFMNMRALRDKYGEMPPVVQLLGSSGWLHPGLAPRGGDDVEGALIVGVCADPTVLGDRGRAFYAAFEARHGRSPRPIEAEAFDAAHLALAAARRAGDASAGERREAAARALAGATLDDGACGPASVRGGALLREPAIYEVDRGEILPRHSPL